MLTVKAFKSAGAAQKYYSHGDYYGSESQGIWFGKGAEVMGLRGEFNAMIERTFSNVLNGVLPDGSRLGRRTKDGIEHRPGIDLTLSCPKSFSIYMMLYASPEERKVMEAAAIKAAQRTLTYIESNGYVEMRKGKDGIEREKVSELIYATFMHTTNRNLEPQVHFHSLLANMAKGSDGKYRSISWESFFDKYNNPNKFLGQIFRNELALEVKKLGMDTYTKMLPDGTSSFELSNIHPHLIKAFSTRRKEIEELCKKYGVTTKEGRDKIVINSRKSKKLVEYDVLINTWKQVEANVMKKLDKDGYSTAKYADASSSLLGASNKLRMVQGVANGINKTEELRTSAITQISLGDQFSKVSNGQFINYNDKITTKDIYRALYNKIPSVLPEFGFVSKGNYYVSTSSYKVDGSGGKRGKVYIYANNPGVIVDYTRGKKTIWDYFSEQVRPGSSKQELFNYLASMAGLKNEPNSKIENIINTEKIDADVIVTPSVSIVEPPKISPELWKHVQDYALEKIEVANNQVVKYLQFERGYSKEMIKGMGIGYIPNKKELGECLKSKGLSETDIKEVTSALGYIGSSHKMVIPYYNQEGNVIGYVGRNIKYTEDSELGKYVYSKGFARNSSLLNIEKAVPNKPVVIVEGILDAAHAKAQGIENILALGGTGLSQGQIELLSNLKTKEITLCMDNDIAGQEATKRILAMLSEKLPEVALKNAELPDNIKDVDQLITEKGKDAFLNVIENAKIIYQPQAEVQTQEQKQNTEMSSVNFTHEVQTNLHKNNHKPSINNTNETSYINKVDNQETDHYVELAVEVSSESKEASALSLRELAMLCIQDASYYKTVFKDEELLTRMMKYSIGNYSIADIQKEISFMEKSGDLIRVGKLYTTKELLQKEREILKLATKGLDAGKQILQEKHFETRCSNFVKREISRNPKFKMNEQQKAALKYVLTSKDKVIAIEGLPGVGKSTVLNAVRDISGHKVLSILGFGEKFKGGAPTASAAKTLESSARVPSATVHSFLGKYNGYLEGRGASSLDWQKQEFKKTVIFLDEASLVSTRMMHSVLKLRELLGFTLVTIGGVEQQSAIEAGNPFERMLTVIPSAKINQIVRQEDDLHREAVAAVAKGDVDTSFKIHANNIEATGKSLKSMTLNVVKAYLQQSKDERDNTLLVSSTRKLRDKINDNIRKELKRSMELNGAVVKHTALRQKDMTAADQKFAPSYSVGDIVKFHRSYQNGINEGDYLTVTKVNEVTNSLILDKNGKSYLYRLKAEANYENKFEVFEKVDLKLQAGLKIKFTKNNNMLGLVNSETASIEKMENGKATLKMEDGKNKTFDIKDLKHIDYGYCTTIYTSQGKTYKNNIAAISKNTWLNNQKTWCVTISRHQSNFTAYVYNKDELHKCLVSNTGKQLSAIELVAKNQQHNVQNGLNIKPVTITINSNMGM